MAVDKEQVWGAVSEERTKELVEEELDRHLRQEEPVPTIGETPPRVPSSLEVPLEEILFGGEARPKPPDDDTKGLERRKPFRYTPRFKTDNIWWTVGSAFSFLVQAPLAGAVWGVDWIINRLDKNERLIEEQQRRHRRHLTDLQEWETNQSLVKEYKKAWVPGLERAENALVTAVQKVGGRKPNPGQLPSRVLTERDRSQATFQAIVAGLTEEVSPQKLIRAGEDGMLAKEGGKLLAEAGLVAGAWRARQLMCQAVENAVAKEIGRPETRENVLAALGCPIDRSGRPIQQLDEVVGAVRAKFQSILGEERYQEATTKLASLQNISYPGLLREIRSAQERFRILLDKGAQMDSRFIDFYQHCLDTDTPRAVEQVLAAYREGDPRAIEFIKRLFPKTGPMEVTRMADPNVLAMAADEHVWVERYVMAFEIASQRDGAFSSLLDIVSGRTSATPERRVQAKTALELLSEAVAPQTREPIIQYLGDIIDAATPGKGRELKRGRFRDIRILRKTLRQTAPEAKAGVPMNRLLSPTGQALGGIAVLAPEALRAVLEGSKKLDVSGGKRSRVIEGLGATLKGQLLDAIHREVLAEARIKGVRQDMLHPATWELLALLTSEHELPPIGVSPKYDSVARGAAFDALIFYQPEVLRIVQSFADHVVGLATGQLEKTPIEAAILMATLAAAGELRIPPERLPRDYARIWTRAAGEVAAEAVSYLLRFDEQTKARLEIEKRNLAQAEARLGEKATEEQKQQLAMLWYALARAGGLMSTAEIGAGLLTSMSRYLPPELAVEAIEPLVDKAETQNPNLALDPRVIKILKALSLYNKLPEPPATTQARSVLIASLVAEATRSVLEPKLRKATADLLEPKEESPLVQLSELFRCLPKAPPEALALETNHYSIPLARTAGEQPPEGSLPIPDLEKLKEPVAYQESVDQLGLQAFGLSVHRPIYRHEAALTVGVYLMSIVLREALGTKQWADLASQAALRGKEEIAFLTSETLPPDEKAKIIGARMMAEEADRDAIRWLEKLGILKPEGAALINFFAQEMQNAGLIVQYRFPRPGFFTLEVWPREQPSRLFKALDPAYLGELEQSLRADLPPVPMDEIISWARHIRETQEELERRGREFPIPKKEANGGG